MVEGVVLKRARAASSLAIKQTLYNPAPSTHRKAKLCHHPQRSAFGAKRRSAGRPTPPG